MARYKGVTVYAPAAATVVGGPLQPLAWEAVKQGIQQQADTPVMAGGVSVPMAKMEGMRAHLIAASQVQDILDASPLTRVENYPCWTEVPSGSVGDAVPVDVLPVGGAWDDEGNEIDPGAPRLWNQMPSYRQLDGRHFCELAYPHNREPLCSGRRPFSSADLRTVIALAGFVLTDNATIRTLQAAEAPEEI